MDKKKRRQERHNRNIQKQKDQRQASWNSGKLLRPQTQRDFWEPGFCKEYGARLVERIKEYKQRVSNGEFDDFEIPTKPGIRYTREELFVFKFRLYKKKIISYILHCSPDMPKDENYWYLKRALETYWDEPDKMYTIL